MSEPSIQTLDLGNVVGPQGPQGAQGPAGTDGRTMRIGSGNPAVDTGEEGDVYLDKDTGSHRFFSNYVEFEAYAAAQENGA